jgi:hypothetical protein
MATERTRLSGTTLDLLSSLTRLSTHFASLLPSYLPPLLRLLCRTNKLYISRTLAALQSIIKNTKLPSILDHIVTEWRGEGGKSASYRIGASELILTMLGGGAGGEVVVEKEFVEQKWLDELEWCIRTGATDKEVKVRAVIKSIWDTYSREWPERVTSFVALSISITQHFRLTLHFICGDPFRFTGPLTPVTKKYLHITNSLSSGTSTSLSTSTNRVPIKRPKAPSPTRGAPATTSTHHATVSQQRLTTIEPKKYNPLSRSAGPSHPSSTSSSHPLPAPTIKQRAVSASSTVKSAPTLPTLSRHAPVVPPSQSLFSLSSQSFVRPTATLPPPVIPASSSTHSLTTSSPYVRTSAYSATSTTPSGFKPSAPNTATTAARVLPASSSRAALESQPPAVPVLARKASRAVITTVTSVVETIPSSGGTSKNTGLFRPKAAAGRVMTAASSINPGKTSGVTSISANRGTGKALLGKSANKISSTTTTGLKPDQILKMAIDIPLPSTARTTTPAVLPSQDQHVLSKSISNSSGLGRINEVDSQEIKARELSGEVEEEEDWEEGTGIGGMLLSVDEPTSTSIEGEGVAEQNIFGDLLGLGPAIAGEEEVISLSLRDIDEEESSSRSISLGSASSSPVQPISSAPVTYSSPLFASAVSSPIRASSLSPVGSSISGSVPHPSTLPIASTTPITLSSIFEDLASLEPESFHTCSIIIEEPSPSSSGIEEVRTMAWNGLGGRVKLPSSSRSKIPSDSEAEKLIRAGLDREEKDDEAMDYESEVIGSEEARKDELITREEGLQTAGINVPVSNVVPVRDLVETLGEVEGEDDNEGDITIEAVPLPQIQNSRSDFFPSPIKLSRITHEEASEYTSLDETRSFALNDDDSLLLDQERNDQFGDDDSILFGRDYHEEAEQEEEEDEEEEDEEGEDEFAQTVIMKTFEEHLPLPLPSSSSFLSSSTSSSESNHTSSTISSGGANKKARGGSVEIGGVVISEDDEGLTNVVGVKKEISLIFHDSGLHGENKLRREVKEDADEEPFLRKSLRSSKSAGTRDVLAECQI